MKNYHEKLTFHFYILFLKNSSELYPVQDTPWFYDKKLFVAECLLLGHLIADSGFI